MENIGAVARALSLASQPGLRPLRAIVPTIRERDLPALFVPAIDRELPRLVMFWEDGGWEDGRSRRGRSKTGRCAASAFS
jgi:hypothetical protein